MTSEEAIAITVELNPDPHIWRPAPPYKLGFSASYQAEWRSTAGWTLRYRPEKRRPWRLFSLTEEHFDSHTFFDVTYPEVLEQASNYFVRAASGLDILQRSLTRGSTPLWSHLRSGVE